MRDNTSPEEKLLKLIKAEKTSTPAYSSDGTPILKPNTKNLLYSFPKKYLIPANIQKLVMGFFVISFLYLIASFVYPWTGLKKIKLPDVPEEKVGVEEPKTELKEEPKPYEFYLQALSQRQIFSSLSAQEGITTSSVASADLVKDINLVGIISGDTPQAVIEDKKTQKTYYLSKGQYIGDLQIEEILEGKIILNYKGQRYELFM